MHKIRVTSLLGLTLLVLLLAACEGYTAMGSSTSNRQGTNGGAVETRINKANGTATQDIEVEGYIGDVLDATVTLQVDKGTFKIELLGENDQVTLALEASNGEAVSGQGEIAVDTFGEASYRVTATEAENVQYSIEYTFR